MQSLEGKGRSWKFGDDVDTDAIISGRYLVLNEPAELAKHAFEGIRPEFARNVREGDIIAAGENFGCGSSREHAPLALKGAGIKCVIAKSFARIFYRNAINTGLPVLECSEVDKISDGDLLEVDFNSGLIVNKTKNETYTTAPLPEFLQEIMRRGGLIEFTKALLRKEIQLR